MVLKYLNNVIKEDDTKEKLLAYKDEYIRNKTIELSSVIDKILLLENLKESVLPRMENMTDDEYIHLVPEHFMNDLEEILDNLNMQVKEIKYLNVPNGNIKIFTADGNVINFWQLNGIARNSKPMDYEFTIE